jgi:hypothetical protein
MDYFDKNIVKVYSHGFGEPGGVNGPTYPDAPGQINKAVFYTKSAVHALANYLKGAGDNGRRIYLKGRSCGAGIVINCLYQLLYYDPVYFEGTAIKSKEDAQAIIDGINRGALELTVPLLSLKKVKVIDTASNFGGYSTAAVGVGALFYMMGAAVLPPVGLVSAGYASYKLVSAVGSRLQNLSACSSNEYIVPAISGQHYDPSHIAPIDAVSSLQDRVKCPVLLHFCKNDGVVANPDEDTIEVYKSLRQGNENNTYIILTDDDSHNYAPHNSQYQQFHRKFADMVYGYGPKIAENQPSVQELGQQIFGVSIFDYKFKRK